MNECSLSFNHFACWPCLCFCAMNIVEKEWFAIFGWDCSITCSMTFLYYAALMYHKIQLFVAYIQLGSHVISITWYVRNSDHEHECFNAHKLSTIWHFGELVERLPRFIFSFFLCLRILFQFNGVLYNANKVSAIHWQSDRRVNRFIFCFACAFHLSHLMLIWIAY